MRYVTVYSRPEDDLTCRQSVKPPLKLKFKKLKGGRYNTSHRAFNQDQSRSRPTPFLVILYNCPHPAHPVHHDHPPTYYPIVCNHPLPWYNALGVRRLQSGPSACRQLSCPNHMYHLCLHSPIWPTFQVAALKLVG